MSNWFRGFLNLKLKIFMNLNKNEGFKIDDPKIFVSWDTNEKTLKNLFRGQNLKHVTDGYYTINISCLDGLNCMLGFHFEPIMNGHLKKLEFFRKDYSDRQKSFSEFQNYFESAFGQPTIVCQGDDGLNSYEWHFNKVKILHYIFDRFGPEEHMEIIISK
jgi:hypothetical protein